MFCDSFGALLVPFGGRLGSLLRSWGSFGRLLEDFGDRLASTWGPWVQLGRLGLPSWSQKSTLLDFLSILNSQIHKNH